MRVLCVIIGYFCGCFLTADIVARHLTGKSACKIGTGNPGMANIGGQFGIKWAAVVLFGDVMKTVVPCLVCRFFLFPRLGAIAILYAGVGTALGHAFPFWNKFRGGRSVAVSCTYIFLFSPVYGIAAEIIGLFAVIATGFLAVGALSIPCLYLIGVIVRYGGEAALVTLAGTALTFFLHRDSIWRMAHKTEKKTDILSKLKKN